MIAASVEAPTTVFGNSITDTGTDPNAPNPPDVSNFQAQLPAGPTPLGGPGAPDGEFARDTSNVLFVRATRTIALQVSVVADGAADRCSFNGVAVPAG